MSDENPAFLCVFGREEIGLANLVTDEDFGACPDGTSEFCCKAKSAVPVSEMMYYTYTHPRQKRGPSSTVDFCQFRDSMKREIRWDILIMLVRFVFCLSTGD